MDAWADPDKKKRRKEKKEKRIYKIERKEKKRRRDGNLQKYIGIFQLIEQMSFLRPFSNNAVHISPI